MPEIVPAESENAHTLSVFLDKLMKDGIALVFPEVASLVEDPATDCVLADWEAAARSELAGEAPQFDREAAVWAARMLYHACRFVACRHLGEDEIVKAFREGCPKAHSPGVDWSVDLIFRQLPEVYRTARHLSNADPLVRELMRLAANWPLSSVGLPIPEPSVPSFLSDPALLQLYVDRVLEGNDLSRLGNPIVDAALRRTIGSYPELAPAIEKKLRVPEV